MLSAEQNLFVWTTPAPIEFLYMLLFGLFIVCTVFPPLEFIAAGVTLENIFGRLLGSENVCFFEFHLYRTTLLRVVCSYFGLIFFVVMRCLSENVSILSPNLQPPFTPWDVVLWFGLALATCGSAHTYFVWYNFGTWSGHPTVKALEKMAEADQSSTATEPSVSRGWKHLASRINAECRNPDKFVAGQGGTAHNWPGRRFVVTNSWILASRFTTFTVIKQSARDLIAVVASAASVLDPGSLTEGGRPAGDSLGMQTMVTVRFTNVETGVCLLTCGLPASNLDTLRAKLQCPLIRASGVELEPTIVQRFVEAFANVVDESDPVVPDTNLELEQCIGCMNHPANVTLIQRCDPAQSIVLDNDPLSFGRNMPACGTCRCRPMWCLDCMARWFASRQTEAHRPPSVWLSGRVPCPTCRAVFCVRDVVRLVGSTRESAT